MKNILVFADKTLKSVKFSVFLMLVIASASIYGTIYPARTPFDFNLYKTPYYIALLILFAINLSYCTTIRVYRQLKGKYESGILGQDVIYISEELQKVKERLILAGYKVVEKDYGLLARKGILRYGAILIIHISIVILLISAASSSIFGFLGTMNVHVGDTKDMVFDWKKKEDIKLPFQIVPHYLFIEYYPMDIKIEIEDPLSGYKEEFVTKEKRLVNFKNKAIFIEKADLTDFSVQFRADGSEQVYKNESSDHGIRIKLKAYLDPVVKQYYCDVELKGIVNKRVSINDPLVYDNYRIYLINTGKDDFGFDYVGFQITKEPFINLIWFSSILLCIALSLYPFLKESYIKAYKEEDKIKIIFYNEKNLFEVNN